jgi:hypothetical protein
VKIDLKTYGARDELELNVFYHDESGTDNLTQVLDVKARNFPIMGISNAVYYLYFLVLLLPIIGFIALIAHMVIIHK